MISRLVRCQSARLANLFRNHFMNVDRSLSAYRVRLSTLLATALQINYILCASAPLREKLLFVFSRYSFRHLPDRTKHLPFNLNGVEPQIDRHLKTFKNLFIGRIQIPERTLFRSDPFLQGLIKG